MNVQSETTHNLKMWSRRILSSYWILWVITVLVSLLNSFLSDLDQNEFLYRYVLIPALILLMILIVVELLTRALEPKINTYIIIFSGACLTLALVLSHPLVRSIESALLLPILVSCIYFRKSQVIFATCITLICFLVIITIEPIIETDPIYIVTMISILITGGVVSLSIITRGTELLGELSRSIKSSQDLMVSKIIMEKISKTDALTDVNNHRAFQEYTDYLLKHFQDLSIHLAVIDIDNFKEVNDTYGHQVGDLILKFTANMIKESISSNDFIARYGGEEFIVLLVDQSKDVAIESVERIRRNLHQVEHHSLNNQKISVSIGLNTYTHTMTKDDWFEGADLALYQAKQTGKNKVVQFGTVNIVNKGGCI